MKTRRADFHLQSAEVKIRDWVKREPYSIEEKDNPDRTEHFFILRPHAITEDVALGVGDFVNCLRSALDQLAWNLVHLFPDTIPATDRAARKIAFPICDTDESYRQKRALFHSSIHGVLDSLQPDDRANAIYTHALWKLDKLWNIDKHRTIPVNCGDWRITIAHGLMRVSHDAINDCFVIGIPCLARVCFKPTYVKPKVVPQILFGEYMGEFSVSIAELRQIYEFVTADAIPRFARFFALVPPLGSY